jgi:hypothetical protein
MAHAAELLAQAWAHRSAGERAAFADRMSAMTSVARTPPPPELLSTVRERAALSGAVEPRDLLGDEDPDISRAVLDALAPDFDRTETDGRWAWTMRTGPRHAALSAMQRTGTVSTVLTGVTDLPTDRSGSVLRRLAAGEGVDLVTASLPAGDAATVVQALTWAAPLGGRSGDLTEARRRADLADLASSYELLVRHGVHGRADELAALRTFANEPLDPARPVPLLPVTGIGGAGKSTLLGAFVLPYIERIVAGDQTAPAVIVLDFDRTLLRLNAGIDLSFEFTRQLGWAAPVASADFSVLRYQLTRERWYARSDRYAGDAALESFTRDTVDFESDAGLLIDLHDLGERPVVLVLDTFEEWQRDRPPDGDGWTWYDPEERILDWIAALRGRMGLEGLRVVVSGRAALTTTAGVEARAPIVLDDLDRPAALDLLAALDVPQDVAGSVVEVAGSNPLTLRVVARFYRGLPSDEERRRFLDDDIDATRGLGAEMRRAVLYDRFLSRVAPEVRALAHPGLVLRRITPDLVRHVLAVPCGLGAIDDQRAAQLTRALTNELWLVKQMPDGIHHQPDVRRAMLRMMATDPAHAAAAREIHTQAIAWYESGRDEHLAAAAAEIEAFYHRLMLQPDDQPLIHGDREDPARPGEPTQRVVRLASALGADVADLPAGVAAQVRAVRGERLSDAESRLLPDPLWSRWIAQRGAALVADDRSEIALERFSAQLPERRVVSEPAWLAQACSSAGCWSSYWPLTRRLDRDASPPVPDDQRSDRYALLNALCSTDSDALAAYDRHLGSYLDGYRPGIGRPAEPAIERLFAVLLRAASAPQGAAAFTAGREALARTLLDGMSQDPSDDSHTDTYPVDQLRRALTWLAVPDGPPVFTVQHLTGMFRPDPEWLADFAALAGERPRAFERYLGRLRDMVGATRRAIAGTAAGSGVPSAHDVLGKWASEFARVWRNRLELRRDEIRPDTIRVLRGDNPELRPAIRLALTSVLTSDDRLPQLAAIARDVLPIPVGDLQPHTVPAGSAPEARSTVIQMVEYVDRAGVMREFLLRAGELAPDADLLHRVTAAYGTWDGAQRRLLAALGARLAGGGGQASPGASAQVPSTTAPPVRIAERAAADPTTPHETAHDVPAEPPRERITGSDAHMPERPSRTEQESTMTTHPFEALHDTDVVLDALPDEIGALIAVRDAYIATLPLTSGGLEFIVADLQRWTPGMTVKVAFLGGSSELHHDIADATRQITDACNLDLDFGFDAAGDARRWSEDDTEYSAHIRVSFDQAGFWSLVGTDSTDDTLAPAFSKIGGHPWQRSLNLGGFDVRRPARWEGTVRHEFLHALAFKHAHQNMRGPCQEDFRWEDDPGYQPTQDDDGRFVPDAAGRRPGIYTYLAGFPNFWARPKVDHNLRTADEQTSVTGRFDSASVMLYRFEPFFYLTEPSPCAPTGDGISLSDEDRRGLRLLYPSTQPELEALAAQRRELQTVASAPAGPESTGGPQSGVESTAGPESPFARRLRRVLADSVAQLP